MKDFLIMLARSFLLLLFCFSSNISAGTTDIPDIGTVRLSGHIPQAVGNAVYVEKLSATTNVPLTFALPLRNQEALNELLTKLYDPSDKEHFGKYLTSQEFVERFSPTEDDYNKVIEYAKSLGMTITNTHSNRTLLNVSASAGVVESAFNLSLHQYETASGRKFHAPNNEPAVPEGLVSLIGGIVGLDNHTKWRPHYRVRKPDSFEMLGATANKFPSGPGGGYAPKDILTAYDLNSVAANGSGQVIALLELAAYNVSDINTYAKYFGLPTPKLKNILVDGGAGTTIDAEVTLDIELALALAPLAQIYVYEGPNSDQGILDTYNKIATDNIAKQISTSWGAGENTNSTNFLNAENAIFQQMAAHGQTIYAAAGDSGAYDDYPDNGSKALVVDDPASQPYVVGVGGTKLTVNSTTGTYSSELVWNDGLSDGAGGGGVSSVWAIPAWQKNFPTTYSKTKRNVPDVALNADTNTGYAIYHAGEWAIYGGTSCAAPLWAAFTARVNQTLVANKKATLGFANPAFYNIALGATAYPNNFHDITSGNNPYYSAHAGYDNASGLGSLKGASLYATLTSTTPPKSIPVLGVSMTHTGNFTKGAVGTYTLTVSNHGTTSTTGAVKVAVALPMGLSYNSFTGTGWTFDSTTLTFTRSSVLAVNATYPAITFKVNVLRNAAATVTPSATVSGGGSVSSSVTNPTTVK